MVSNKWLQLAAEHQKYCVAGLGSDACHGVTRSLCLIGAGRGVTDGDGRCRFADFEAEEEERTGSLDDEG